MAGHAIEQVVGSQSSSHINASVTIAAVMTNPRVLKQPAAIATKKTQAH